MAGWSSISSWSIQGTLRDIRTCTLSSRMNCFRDNDITGDALHVVR